MLAGGFFSDSDIALSSSGIRSYASREKGAAGADLNDARLLGAGRSMKPALFFFGNFILIMGLATFVLSGKACGGIEIACEEICLCSVGSN